LGALKSVSNYKYENSKFKLIHKKEYEYEARIMPLWPRVVYSFMARIWIPLTPYRGAPENLYNYSSGQYGISIGKLLMTKETDIYMDSVQLNKETRYAYGNNTYLQPTQIVRTNSNSQTEVTTMKFPYDFQSTGIYAEMVAKNMISPTIEKKVEAGYSKTTKTNYSNFSGLYLPSSVETSYNGQSYIREITFNSYDSNGNILEMTGKDGLKKSYIWGYNNKYPVAEITGKSLSEIPGSLLNGTVINNPASDAALKTELAKLHTLTGSSLITTLTYKPLVGITSQTSPQQLTTSYEYDIYGRLVNIKDHMGNLLENYAYSMKNSPNSNIGSGYMSISYPIMESYNKICLPNSQIGFANYIESSRQDVWGDLDSRGQPAINGDQSVVCTPASGYAKIKFVSMMNQSGRIKIDFVQDGHVVATRRYSYDTMLKPLKETEIYIPAGKYNIIFKNEDYNYFGKNAFRYYMNNRSVGSGYYVSNKELCNFVGGHEYQITVTNIY
jgi:YD repeat-containing protein